MIGIFITWWWWSHQKNDSGKESVGLLEGATNVNDYFQVVEVYDSWWEMPEDPHNTELGRFQAEVGNDFAKINKKIWKLLVIFLLVLIISEQGWEVRPGGGAAGWLSGRFSRKSKKFWHWCWCWRWTSCQTQFQGKPSRTLEAVLNGFPHSATCVGRTFSQGGRLGMKNIYQRRWNFIPRFSDFIYFSISSLQFVGVVTIGSSLPPSHPSNPLNTINIFAQPVALLQRFFFTKNFLIYLYHF